jgi:hypothetical protein
MALTFSYAVQLDWDARLGGYDTGTIHAFRNRRERDKWIAAEDENCRRERITGHSDIRDADLLLFQKRGLVSIYGRGRHSHSAIAGWWGDDLMCLEVREWYGGRAVTLESQVQKFPLRIDVYRANARNRYPEFDRAGTVSVMRKMCGKPYGWWKIKGIAVGHLFGIRLFDVVDQHDDAVPDGPPICSEAVAIASRLGGGVDPVRELADRRTEPSDLARSTFYEYLFTLVP